MNIICMGDSITYGFGLDDLSLRWSDQTAARTGHTLLNRGVSGDTTAGMLARCQTEVFPHKPNALVLLGGINDISITGQYRTALANVISIFRQADRLSIPLILGIPLPVSATLCPPVWDPSQDMAHIAALGEEYAALLRRYAEEQSIRIADFRAAFLDAEGKVMDGLLSDGLHPNAEGHRRMADVLCTVLETWETDGHSV